jgi:pyruvate,water dikinase
MEDFGMEAPNILWFREIRIKDIPSVGGKGASLGEMANHNFPVPPGFVVTAQAYFRHLEATGIKNEVISKIDAIDVENTEQLAKDTEEVRKLILATPMSEELANEIKRAYGKLGERKIAWLTSSEEEFVAVRSSATAEDLPEASFAGQQESFLNVKGRQSLVKTIQRCWASLFTARAVYYRKKNNFPTETVGIAVVVQKMVNGQQSGIMFTAEPTGDETKILIEAGFGLGEAIVSGSVTPDTYTVDKGSFKIIEKKIHEQDFKIVKKGKENVREKLSTAISRKQKIDDKTIVQLAKLGKQVEQHYKKPQDIEWAIENKELFIVQSRPITTLGLKDKGSSKEEREKQLSSLKDNVILNGLAASPGVSSGKAKVVRNVAQINKVEKGDILVAPMTSPDWVPTMKKSRAIITDEGGVTCHAAIVSRELGIPCVVGTEKATEILGDGNQVTVNGYDGVVYKGVVEIEKPKVKEIEIIKLNEFDKIEEILKEEGKEEPEKREEPALKQEKVQGKQLGVKELAARVEEERDEVAEKASEEAKDIVTEFGGKKAEEMPKAEQMEEEERIVDLLRKVAPVVKVNVALPEAAEEAAKTNAGGVGLLRAEHMITSSGKHPAQFIREGKQEELVKVIKEGIKKVASLFKGKPVWYRTFDARTDEFRGLEGGSKEPEEDNPMLGWHGIRRDLDQPELLKAQFKAIKELREEGLDNVGVMLPFVQSAEEVRAAKKIAEEAGLIGKAKFGVMIETPASVWGIDEILREKIDFISFGTNDLTQLTLGIDRNNEKIQGLFTELHPAVVRSLKHVIWKCRKERVLTSICGQAASKPEMVKHLVEFGIDSISANIDAVERIRDVVLAEEKKLILGNGRRE